MIRHAEARLVVASRDICGESALWDPDAARLYWLDLYRPTLHALDPATGTHTAWPVEGAERLACLLRAGDGGLPLLVSADAIGRLHPAPTGGMRFRSERPLPLVGPREAANDGKAHPSGAVWIGTADIEESAPLGRLAVHRDGVVGPILQPPMIVANGPSFAPDGGAAYLSDSAPRHLLRYPVASDGQAAGPPTILARFTAAQGHPDGSTVDAEGCIWVAMWDGAAVLRLSPAGEILSCLPLPVPRATSCAFGGPDLATLYVTTAAFELDAATVAAGAGALFAAEVGVRGRVEPVATP